MSKPPAVFCVAHLGFWCLPERSKRNHGRRRTFQMAWPVGVWMWPSWYPPKKQKNNETCQGGMVTFNCPAGTFRTSWGSWKTSKDGFRHAEELIPLRDVPKWLNIEDLQQLQQEVKRQVVLRQVVLTQSDSVSVLPPLRSILRFHGGWGGVWNG